MQAAALGEALRLARARVQALAADDIEGFESLDLEYAAACTALVGQDQEAISRQIHSLHELMALHQLATVEMSRISGEAGARLAQLHSARKTRSAYRSAGPVNEP